MTTFNPADDGFHFDVMSDRWWETETAWYSFCVPERRLGGWLYTMVRPNIGSVAGGAWVWDASAHLPWEVLYSANYSTLRLPEGADLRDVVLPTGVRMTTAVPCTEYDLGYDDAPRLTMALRFAAVMEPFPLAHGDSSYGASRHFDQFGRVTGTIVLHGEEIAVDCLAMRDRSWGPRVEHRPRQTSYVTGITDARTGFLALCGAGTDESEVSYGFLLRDGVPRRLVSGVRRVVRDPGSGATTAIVVQGVDEDGRTVHASGRAVSRIVINRHTMIDSNSLVEWSIDGEVGWGEDQDLWPMTDFAEYRRAMRASVPTPGDR
jgi:hypothetical protein